MKLYSFALVFLLSVLCSVQSWGLTSGFTADHLSGCAPLVVHFQPNDPACSSCLYSWDFGTGSPIVGYNVSSSFLAPGTYTVTLTVTKADTTSTSAVNITIYPNPVVDFGVSDTSICPGTSVAFSNSSSSGTVGGFTSVWSFGDGGTGASNTISHTYLVPGYYNVSLSVTNVPGCTSTLTKNTYVHVFTPPVANFVASPVNICQLPGSTTFTNTGSSGSGNTYLWTFGDGFSSGASSPPHSYASSGNYSVKLVVTSADGCRDSMTRSNYIYADNVVATFTSPATACVYASVPFVNTSLSYAFRMWEFGDGATATTVNASHVYTATGTYTVKLTVYNGPCTHTTTRILNVVTGPPGTFNISPDVPCPAPTTITYTSTGPPGTIVKWIYGPADTSVGTTTSHLYGSNGIKSVTMVMMDPATGCRDTVTRTDTIYNLIYRASPNPNKGCVPLTTVLSSAVFTTTPDNMDHPYPLSQSTYLWNFGDGSATVGGATPAHTFTAAGTYTTTVTGLTANGCPDTAKTVIKAGSREPATFTAAPLHLCYKRTDTVYFTASADMTLVDSFQWAWGTDGATHTNGVDAWHIFTMPGIFTVTVTPYYNGCKGDSFVREDYIRVDSPKAMLDFVYDCVHHKQIAFFDSSFGDNDHLWLFSDSTTSTEDDPVHIFPVLDSTYNVTLTTHNAASGCRDTTEVQVHPLQLIPDFVADTVHICPGDSVVFTSHDTGGFVSVRQWYVNGVEVADEHRVKWGRRFHTAGYYTVEEQLTDANGCIERLSRADYVKVADPIAIFSTTPISGCVPLNVVFSDSSKDQPFRSFPNYAWKFGDGATMTGSAPVVNHTYSLAGSYSITEIVTDDYGCKDTAYRTITAYKARAFFVASNQNPCVNVPATFTPLTTGLVGYSWDFGDGGLSTAVVPAHAYSTTGNYDVKLIVTDVNGCTDTLVNAGYMGVQRPGAQFTMSDSSAVCAPLTVNFTNSSSGAVSYSWLFGDGNSSINEHPINVYAVPGVFNVRLVATNTYGCKDTATNHVSLYGYAGAFSYAITSGCNPLSVKFTATLTNVPNLVWDFADGITTAVSTTDTISHTYTIAGSYVPKLILKDSSGCQTSSIGIDTIKVDEVKAKFGTVPNPVCLGVMFNLVDSSTTVWAPATSWAWTYDGHTSMASSPSYTINTPGTYPVHLQVTDGWGCTGVYDRDIVVTNATPVTGVTSVCVGLNTTLSNATTGGTWSSASPAIASVGSTGEVTGIAAGTALITYFIGDCFATTVVTVNPAPSMIAGNLDMCRGAGTILNDTVTGGSWTTADTTITIDVLTGVVNGIWAGTATVSYSLGGCVVSAVATVNQIPSVITGVATICMGTTTLNNAVAGGSWSSGNMPVAIADAVTGEVTGVTAGVAPITYTLTGNCAAYTTVTVSVPPDPGVISGPDTVCQGAAIALTNIAAGGTWSCSNANALINAAGVVTGSVAGGDTVLYIVHNLLCADTATKTLTIEAMPDAGMITGDSVLCAGKMVTIAASQAGGTWTSADASVATVDNSGGVRSVAAGSTTITYTKNTPGSRCKSYVTMSIRVTPPFAIDKSVTDVNCYGAHTGAIDLRVRGGAAPFRFQWTNGDTSAVLLALPAGGYAVQVTELTTQCSLRDSFHIAEPDSVHIGTEVKKDDCKVGNGGIRTNITGGVSPYLYLWSTNSAGNELSNLPTGTYTLTLTDAKGCIKQVAVEVPDTSCPGVVIYNGVSPNGDGNNDTWIIEGLAFYPENTVQVFDKWGDLVYEHTNYQSDWSGVGKKGMLPDGTYYYIVKLNADNYSGGPNVFTGAVLIKR